MAGHNDVGLAGGSRGANNEVIDDTPFNPDELLTSPLFNDSTGKLSVNLDDSTFGNTNPDDDELAKFCDDADDSNRSNPLNGGQRKIDSAPRSPKRSTRSPIDRDALIGELTNNINRNAIRKTLADTRTNQTSKSTSSNNCGSPRNSRGAPHMAPSRPTRALSDEELPIGYQRGANGADQQIGVSPGCVQNRNIADIYRQRSDEDDYDGSPPRRGRKMGYQNDNQSNLSRSSSACSYSSMPGNGMQRMHSNGMQGMQGMQGNGMHQMSQPYDNSSSGYADQNIHGQQQGSGYNPNQPDSGNNYDAMQLRQMQQQDMQRRRLQQQQQQQQQEMQMQMQQQQQMQMQMNRQRANSCNQAQSLYGPNQSYDMNMQQFDGTYNVDQMPHNQYQGDQMQRINPRNSYNGDNMRMNNQFNQYNGDQFRGSYRDSIGNDSFRSHESEQSSQIHSQGVPDSLLGGMNYGDNGVEMGYNDDGYICNNGAYNNGNMSNAPAPGYASFHANNNNVSIASDLQPPSKPYISDSSPSSGNPNPAINEAMEKLCERMKQSAMSRNMIKQFSGRNLVKQSSGRSLIASQNSASLVLAKQRSNRVLMRQASDRGPNMSASDCSALALQRQASCRGLARQQSNRGLVKQPSARGLVKQGSARGLTREPSLRGLVRRPSNTKHHLQHPGRGVYGHDSHPNLGGANLGNNGLTLSIDGRNVGNI